MISLRDRLLLLNLFLLFLLNYGYMQLRIPLSQSGVPISEWLLLLTVLTVRHGAVLKFMRDPVFLIPYLTWIGFGMVNICLSYWEHGIRAVRDGLPVIEAVFIYAGFVMARNIAALDMLAKWFPRILVVCTVYITLYPFRVPLAEISPWVSGAQGQPVPVFFAFTTTSFSMTLVVATAYMLEKYNQTKAFRFAVTAAVASGLALVFVPSRTLLLMLIALVIYFVYSNGIRAVLGLVWAVTIAGAVTAAVLSIGIEGTRLGFSSITEYGNLFLEIFTEPDPEHGISSGNSTRWEWWFELMERVNQSWTTLLFGLGYGKPLIDFHMPTGVAVSEPHNAFMGALGRGGVIAATSFVWLHAVIVYRAIRVVRYFRQARLDSSVVVGLLFIIFCVLITGIGESPFVVPYLAVPYYFSAGILLGVENFLLRGKMSSSPGTKSATAVARNGMGRVV